MIVTDLFPTVTEPTNEIGFSDTISNLALSYPDGFPDAYYMGWVSWENLTKAAHVSRCTIDGNAGLTFTDITTPQNANVGYLVNYETSINDKPGGGNNGKTILSISDHSGVFGVGNKSTTPNINDNFMFRFINKLSVQSVMPMDMDIYVKFCCRVDKLNQTSGVMGEYTVHTDLTTLFGFLNGTSDLIINEQPFSNVHININDIDENNLWYQTAAGLNYFIALVGVQCEPYLSTNNNNYNRIYPFLYTTNTIGATQRKIFTTYHSYNMPYLQYNPGVGFVASPTAFDVFDSTFYFRGSWNGTLTNDEFSQMNNGRGTKVDGTCIFVKSSNQLIVYNILSPTDLNNFFALHMRATTALNWHLTDGFTDDIYYPHISADNEYLCEWLNGDFEDIQDDLRPWQYGDITDNVYNSEDLPPYEPPRDENENTGDKITRPATLGAGGTLGFITQYALRAADVTELGGLLWTSIFTSDYWKNYMFSLALDTGSLDLASILNFFISLRVYPFPLVNVPSYAQFGQDMYIGTGIMPLHFANNLHTINNYCDYVPGGSATVWNQSGRTTFFGDWRDYTNTEIILYIPYCGTVQLNPGDVVGNTVSVQYAVDFATGGCIAYVDLETGDGAGYPIAALPGQMGADIPLTATAAGQVAARLAGDAMNVAHLIGRGESEFIGGSVGAFGAAATGNIGGTVNALASLAGAPADMYGGLARQAVNMLSRGAVSAPMLGGARGFASFGAPQTPYIQIRRGIYPDFGADIMGNATAGVYTVGDLSGFVSGEIKTDSLSCSDYEKSQIKQLISRGIYV